MNSSITPLLQRSSGTASSRRGPSRSIQYAEPFGDGLAVNPGSVGQPLDGDPDAAYGVVDLSDLSVDLCRVPYDIERVQQRIEGTPISGRNGERLVFD